MLWKKKGRTGLGIRDQGTSEILGPEESFLRKGHWRKGRK